MITDVLTEFGREATSRPRQIATDHAQGTKLVAYTGSYVPDELIAAAGAIPYPMWRGGEPDCADAAIPYTCRFLNPLYRSILGLYIKGVDPILRTMDALAVSIPDVQVARIAENMEFQGVSVARVGVPTEWQAQADFDYYLDQVEELKRVVEELTGQPATDENLVAYIKKTNRINELLRQIDALRKTDNPPLSGTEFIKVNHWSVVCDPDTSIAMLEKLLEAIEAQRDERRFPADMKRIILAGHAVAIGDYIVTQALEEAGCLIVGELLDDTYRHFEHDIALDGNPLEALCRNRYLDRYPMNNFQPSWALRQERILQAFDERNADAVVWYDLLYDELHDMEFTLLARLTSDKAIPLLRITSSYEFTREAMGPLNTRIDTFAELLKG